MSNKKSMLVSHDWLPLFRAMEEHDVCEILFALLEYDQTGKKPTLKFKNKLVNSIYQNMLGYVEENHLLYVERCEKNSQNAKSNRKRPQATANERERTHADMIREDKIRLDKNRDDVSRDDKSDSSTHTPTLAELRSFCQQEGLDINTEKFWNYYEGINWQRNGQLINWQAQARFWDSQDKENKKTTPFQQFTQRAQDFDKIEDEWLAQ